MSVDFKSSMPKGEGAVVVITSCMPLKVWHCHLRDGCNHSFSFVYDWHQSAKETVTYDGHPSATATGPCFSSDSASSLELRQSGGLIGSRQSYW